MKTGIIKKLPFFLPFGGCKGRCVYCNQRTITGICVIPSPERVAESVAQQKVPVEVCFFGGSFCRLGYDKIKAYLDAVINNGCDGNTIRFSTYPNDLMDKRIRDLVLSYPISRIELGVPSMDANVLTACRRDADPQKIVSNVKLLKDLNVPLGLQIMIGLPGQSIESSINDIKLWAGVKGDSHWEMRLYPCLVIRNTELEKMMKSGSYRPLELGDAVAWGGLLLKLATSYGFVIIRAGLQESELLAQEVVGGPHHPALGELMMADFWARNLAENMDLPRWDVSKRDMSKFTGHGKFGIKCIKKYCGLDESEIKERLHFI